jgi:glucokinase
LPGLCGRRLGSKKEDQAVERNIWAGVDIGGTKTAVVLSEAPPELLNRVEFPTLPVLGPQQTIDRLMAELHRMLVEPKAGTAALRGIGISCGGPLNPHTGVIQSPPNLATWVDVPIVKILSSEFGVPVLLENDANAGALAEHRYGAGRGTHHMVFLTLGTGLGGGIIIGDKLYRGASDMAGEIGHVRLTPEGPVGYNKAGSAEGWASGAGLIQIADEELKAARQRGSKSLLFDLPQGRPETARDVGLAAEQGDALARRIITISGEKLGIALAVLVDVLNPERIVVGGLAMRLGALLLDPAKESLRREALQPALAACTIVTAELGERIGDVAALCVAMDAGREE